MERISLAAGDRPWHHLGARRPRGDADGRDQRRPAAARRAAFQRCANWCDKLGLPDRCGAWLPGLRPPDRSPRAAQVFFHQSGDLSARSGAHRLFVESLELRAVPVHHGRRYRRRILGGQLRHRRTYPGAISRPRRSDDQWQFLAGSRRRRRVHGDSAQSEDLPGQPRMASGLRCRRGYRPEHPVHAPVHPGEPALAGHPRAARGGRNNRRRHRADGWRAKPACGWWIRRPTRHCG